MNDGKARAIRRVVTGHDSSGSARILFDSPATNRNPAGDGVVSTTVWCTNRTPADISVGTGFEDMGERRLGVPPPQNGSRFVVLDFAPGSVAGMHRTETLDYVIVVAGEIDMDSDRETTTLKTGDVLVQRGTNHSWVNRSDAPARIAFVLIDADPLGIGQPITRGGQVS